MEDAIKGLSVDIPFDEAIVKFLWKRERELEIMEVVLADIALKEQRERLQLEEDKIFLSKIDEESNLDKEDGTEE